MTNILRSGMKEKIKVGTFILSSMGMISCGGGGGSSGGNTQETSVPPPVQEQPQYLAGQLSFGKLDGVQMIFEYQGVVLYTTTTNNDGEFVIDATKIKNQLTQRGFPLDSAIKIYSSSGVLQSDVGQGLQKMSYKKGGSYFRKISGTQAQAIYGSLKTYADLTHMSNIIISPVSTYVAELLEHNKETLYPNSNVTQELVERFYSHMGKQIGLTDVTNDGKIDYKDLYAYNHNTHESEFETQLGKNGFIQAILSGTPSQIESILNQEKEKYNVILPKQKNNMVFLDGGGMYSTKYYSFDNNTWYIYQNSGIVITQNQSGTLYYKEVFQDQKQSGVQTFSYEAFVVSPPSGGGTIPENPSGGGNTGGNPGGSGEVDVPDIPDSGDEDDTSNVPTYPQETPVEDNYIPVALSSLPDGGKDLPTLQQEQQKLDDQIKMLQAQLQQNTIDSQQAQAQAKLAEEKVSYMYSNLPPIGQTLVNANISLEQKRNTLDQNYALDSTPTLLALQSYTVRAIPVLAKSLGYQTLSYDTQTALNELERKKMTLSSTVDNLARKVDETRLAYELKYSEYKLAVEDYNRYLQGKKYLVDNYTSTKEQYDTIFNQLKQEGTLPGLNLNIASIISQWNVSTAKNRLQERFNAQIKPSYRDYKIDVNTSYQKGKIYQEADLNFLGNHYQFSFIYGQYLASSYPADFFITSNQGETLRIKIANEQHKQAVIEYYKKDIMTQASLQKLNLLLPYEERKNSLYQQLLNLKEEKEAQIEIFAQEKKIYEDLLKRHERYTAVYDIKFRDLTQLESQIQALHKEVLLKNEWDESIQVYEKKTQENQKQQSNIQNQLQDLQKLISQGDFQKYNQLFDGLYSQLIQGYVPSGVFELNEYPALGSYVLPLKPSDYRGVVFESFVEYGNEERGGELKLFPAKVWLEYDDPVYSGMRRTTPFIMAKNPSQVEDIRRFFQTKLKLYIDLALASEGQLTYRYLRDYGKNEVSSFDAKQMFLNRSIGTYQKEFQVAGTTLDVKTLSTKTITSGDIDKMKKTSQSYLNGVSQGAMAYARESMDIKSHLQGIVDGGKGAYNGLSKGMKDTALLGALGVAGIAKKINNSAINQKTYENLLEKIEGSGQETLQEVESFLAMVKDLSDGVMYVLQNPDYIKNPEYWGGYLNGYLSGVVAEGVAMVSLTKNAKATYAYMIQTKAYINLINHLQRFKLLISIGKTTQYVLGYERLEKAFTALEKMPCGSVKGFQTMSLKSVSSSSLVCNLSGEYKKIVEMARKHGYSQEKYSRFEARFGEMSKEMQQQIIKNPEHYIKDFEVGGKYNMLKVVDEMGETTALKIVNGEIKLPDGRNPKGKQFDYVLLKEGDSYRLVFGQGHSYLSMGKNVEYAGRIKFTNNGSIKYVDNGSGHYRPNFDDLNGKIKVLDAFKNRFGIKIDMSLFQEYNY